YLPLCCRFRKLCRLVSLLNLLFLSLILRPPPPFALFPYTTLFRSNPCWVLSEAGLEHIAHDDLIDIFPFYPVLFDNAPYHLRSKIGGRNPLETSAKRSYCGTTCICNHYFLHDSPPIWKFRRSEEHT